VSAVKPPDLGTDVRAAWREDSACAGAPFEFVDVADLELAEYLIRRYCHRCPVLSECNDYADSLRPEKWLSVYGGRVLGIASRRQRKAS